VGDLRLERDAEALRFALRSRQRRRAEIAPEHAVAVERQADRLRADAARAVEHIERAGFAEALPQHLVEHVAVAADDVPPGAHQVVVVRTERVVEARDVLGHPGEPVTDRPLPTSGHGFRGYRPVTSYADPPGTGGLVPDRPRGGT